jgi:two-component system, response regulator
MQQGTEIILVEDNVSDADLIMRSLKKNNFTNSILHLQDGQEALHYFFGRTDTEKKMQIFPKVILLDLKMPKVSGIEVLGQLKKSEQTRHIPVIMLSSSKEDSDLEKCYQLGANSYVVKPVAFDDFVKAVSQMGLYWLLINEPLNNK